MVSILVAKESTSKALVFDVDAQVASILDLDVGNNWNDLLDVMEDITERWLTLLQQTIALNK